MTQIKRGTTPTIRVRMDGIKPEGVKSVEFLIKPFITDEGHELLHKAYPGDVTYDDTEALWLLPLTQDDTRRLPIRPHGTVWTREDGVSFAGEMVAPWKPFEELASAQAAYERRQLADYMEALKIVGVSV